MLRVPYLLLGFLLAGCAVTPTAFIPSDESPTPLAPISSSTQPFLPASLSASPTATFLPTETPTSRPTATVTGTATETPVVYPHIFPLQPPEAAGFAEGTASHGYPATDIFAVVGTNFVAVTDGVVDFVSNEDLWNPENDDPAVRGGLSVAIIGDDGLRYYGSHLSAVAAGIAPGVRVTAGQLLGQVGNSGDARNTLSHLHFGISRPTTPDDWKARRGQVDPFPFLQAWKDGNNVTPPLPSP
jgi:murein DD-endopeptidase MepM/ murein hydrolase activator NlpD